MILHVNELPESKKKIIIIIKIDTINFQPIENPRFRMVIFDETIL